jgi:hypothetical protein
VADHFVLDQGDQRDGKSVCRAERVYDGGLIAVTVFGSLERRCCDLADGFCVSWVSGRIL